MLLLAAAAVAGTAAPGAALQLEVGLLLLGLGWSCGLIAGLVAGSTLVTESVDALVRPAAQGVPACSWASAPRWPEWSAHRCSPGVV